MVEPGTILLGKYRIERILGRGGMGVVALAHHLHLDEPMAIKFLQKGVLEKPEIASRFQREARAAVKLKSEHVCSIFDVGELADGSPYMVMEYLHGMDLGEYKRAHSVPLEVAVDMVLQACQALAEAHALGIVHRDIKPANFFVTHRSDGSLLIKLLDFGISKATKDADVDLTTTQTTLGTPAYMSPEHMRSSRDVDARTDIWSLGVVLHELLCGERPFVASSFTALCLKVAMEPVPPMPAHIPADLQAVVLRCLAKEPGERFQNVAELAAALEPFGTQAHSGASHSQRAATVLGLASVPGATRRAATPVPRDKPANPARSGNPGTDVDTLVSGAAQTHPKRPVGAMRPAEAQEKAPAQGRSRWLAVGLMAALLGAAGIAAFVLTRDMDRDAETLSATTDGTAEELAALGLGDAGPVRDAGAVATPEVTPEVPMTEEPDASPVVARRRFTVVSVPDGAQVSLDGEEQGPTPFEVELDEGESRTYEVSRRGYRDETVTLPADADEDGTVQLTLERATKAKGTLVISVATWAEVFIDGKSHGYVPNRFQIPVGAHRITLVNDSIGRKETMKVKIRAGKTVTIKREW